MIALELRSPLNQTVYHISKPVRTGIRALLLLCKDAEASASLCLFPTVDHRPRTSSTPRNE